MRSKFVVAAALLALGLQAAAAQTGGPAATRPDQSEASHQNSPMGPATANQDAGNNGVGTLGSLDSSPGKATSTVAGVNGGTTGKVGTASLKRNPCTSGSPRRKCRSQ